MEEYDGLSKYGIIRLFGYSSPEPEDPLFPEDMSSWASTSFFLETSLGSLVQITLPIPTLPYNILTLGSPLPL